MLISDLRYVLWHFQRNHRAALVQHAYGNHGDEGWDSKIGEDAGGECASSNAVNAIVKTNRSSKRAIKGLITNPPERAGDVYFRNRVVIASERTTPNLNEAFAQLNICKGIA
jgi:hypothetical protein